MARHEKIKFTEEQRLWIYKEFLTDVESQKEVHKEFIKTFPIKIAYVTFTKLLKEYGLTPLKFQRKNITAVQMANLKHKVKELILLNFECIEIFRELFEKSNFLNLSIKYENFKKIYLSSKCDLLEMIHEQIDPVVATNQMLTGIEYQLKRIVSKQMENDANNEEINTELLKQYDKLINTKMKLTQPTEKNKTPDNSNDDFFGINNGERHVDSEGNVYYIHNVGMTIEPPLSIRMKEREKNN